MNKQEISTGEKKNQAEILKLKNITSKFKSNWMGLNLTQIRNNRGLSEFEDRLMKIT